MVVEQLFYFVDPSVEVVRMDPQLEIEVQVLREEDLQWVLIPSIKVVHHLDDPCLETRG